MAFDESSLEIYEAPSEVVVDGHMGLDARRADLCDLLNQPSRPTQEEIDAAVSRCNERANPGQAFLVEEDVRRAIASRALL